MFLNGACYIRVSTEEQTEYSPDAQLRSLKDYANKNEIILNEKHIYIDEGISGRKADKRPAFMKMIAAAKTKPKPFDVILVHKFDRFARSREDSVVYKALLKKEAGIRVVSITESIEDDKFAVILEAMLEAMAEYYSLNLSDEVMKGMMEKARRGGVMGRAPYGYTNSQKGCPPIIKEDEAVIVRLIFNKALGGLKPYTIARFLNTSGIKTGKGGSWSAAAVKYILSNNFYTGDLVWNKYQRGTMKMKDEAEWITAKGGHEPIIGSETFKFVNEAINIQSSDKKQPHGECCHWLSGLLKCSNCDKTLSLTSKKNKYPAFQCHAYNKGMCGISHYVPVQAVETAVINSLNSFLKNPEKINYYKKISLSENIELEKHLEGRIKKSYEMLDRARTAYLSGTDTLKEYTDNKETVNKEIASLEKELNILKSSCPSPPESKPCIFFIIEMLKDDNIAAEIKNTILRSFVKKIIFVKEKKTIEVFFYTPVNNLS